MFWKPKKTLREIIEEEDDELEKQRNALANAGRVGQDAGNAPAGELLSGGNNFGMLNTPANDMSGAAQTRTFLTKDADGALVWNSPFEKALTGNNAQSAAEPEQKNLRQIIEETEQELNGTNGAMLNVADNRNFTTKPFEDATLQAAVDGTSTLDGSLIDKNYAVSGSNAFVHQPIGADGVNETGKFEPTNPGDTTEWQRRQAFVDAENAAKIANGDKLTPFCNIYTARTAAENGIYFPPYKDDKETIQTNADYMNEYMGKSDEFKTIPNLQNGDLNHAEAARLRELGYDVFVSSEEADGKPGHIAKVEQGMGHSATWGIQVPFVHGSKGGEEPKTERLSEQFSKMLQPKMKYFVYRRRKK